MTIQDILDWCKNAKAPTHPDGYPLTAKLLLSSRDGGFEYELRIAGCEGHGHKWEDPEKLFLEIAEV